MPPTEKKRIRVLVLGLIQDGDRCFLSEGSDPASGQRFWRPLGGGVDFAEPSERALKREFREEIDQPITVSGEPIVFENIFTYAGRPHHEIVFLYRARFVNAEMLTTDELHFTEPGPDGRSHRAAWVSLDELARQSTPLYPTGLLDTLLNSKP